MATRVNECTNPCLGVDAAGYVGDNYARATGLSGLARTTGVAVGADGYVGTPAATCTADEVWSVSCEVRHGVTAAVEVSVEWRTVEDVFISSTAAYPTLTADVATRVSVAGQTAPVTAGRVLCFLSTFVAHAAADVTAFQLERSPSATSYFDGDSQYAAWSGTAHASSSSIGDLVTGVVACTLPAPVLVATGLRTVSGVAVCALPAASLAVTGLRTVHGAAVLAPSAPVLVVLGQAPTPDVASIGLPPPDVAIVGTVARPPVPTGSWYSLLDFVHDMHDPAPVETDCPNDGVQMSVGRDGRLHCPFDGYVTDPR